MPSSVSDYDSRREIAERGVVRWVHASGPVLSPLPLAVELSEIPRGTVLQDDLAEPPAALADGAYAYGLREDGQVAVERMGTEFPDQFYETFVLPAPDGFTLYRYGYRSLRALLSTTHATVDAQGRVVRTVSVAARAGASEQRERYVYHRDRLVHIDFDYATSGGGRTWGQYVVVYQDGQVREILQRYSYGYERVVYPHPE